MSNQRRWYKIGLFDNEDIAKKLVPHFFKDVRYEARFQAEGKRDALYVNEAFYDLMNLEK
jgi:hypothetical protein